MTESLSSHAQASSYAASGYGNRMGWGTRPALLLIDVCRAYWTPGSPLDCSAHVPTRSCPDVMRRLLSAAREGNGDGNSCPVLWTAVEFTDPDMADAGLFWRKSKTLDVWRVGDGRGLGDWVEGLVPLTGGNDGTEAGGAGKAAEIVVKKKYASGFFGTTLATQLQVLGVDTVVLCGVSTSGCVRATALDAMQHGFRPMVVGSACGDRSDEIQNANLFDLNAKYADVVTEEEAIEHLKKGWPKV